MKETPEQLLKQVFWKYAHSGNKAEEIKSTKRV
jgi:hypothetical protein